MKLVNTSLVRFAIFSRVVYQNGIIDLDVALTTYNNIVIFVSGNVLTDITGDRFINLSDLTITFINSSILVSLMIPYDFRLENVSWE